MAKTSSALIAVANFNAVRMSDPYAAAGAVDVDAVGVSIRRQPSGGTMADDSIVWILGAGFTKSLGGPLLEEFFSPQLQQRVANRFPMPGRVVGINRLHAVYGFESVAKEDGTRPWNNAEEFLELLVP